MMNRRHFTAFAGAALAPNRAHAGTQWRLATGYRSDSFHTVNLAAMAAEVDAATSGELRIAIHPDGTLVKLPEIRAAVQGATIQAGETIMTSLVAEMPIAGADSVPFITGSYDDARRMWHSQRPLIERQFASRGLNVLYAVAWPPQGLFTTTPVGDIADLRGRRMRTYNATTRRIAALVGAQAVEMPTGEIAAALADGRVDSMITSAVTGVENKVWSHVHHCYEINAWFPKNIVFANARARDALTPATREALARAAVTAEARGWAASEAAARASVDELRRNGIKIERVPREFSASIKRLGERFSLEWVRRVGPEANEIFVPYFTRS